MPQTAPCNLLHRSPDIETPHPLFNDQQHIPSNKLRHALLLLGPSHKLRHALLLLGTRALVDVLFVAVVVYLCSLVEGIKINKNVDFRSGGAEVYPASGFPVESPDFFPAPKGALPPIF